MWCMEVKSRGYKQSKQNPNKQQWEQQERVSQQGMGRSIIELCQIFKEELMPMVLRPFRKIETGRNNS